MIKRYPNTSMSLFVVPMMCEPLVCHPTDVCLRQNPEFSQLELADSTGPNSKLQIDILVGPDQCRSNINVTIGSRVLEIWQNTKTDKTDRI